MEKKRLISYLSLILFSILFLVFLVWPRYYKFLELKRAISELEKTSKSYKEYFSKIEETFSKVKEREEEVSKIKSALPLDPQIPETFNFLKNAASESGLQLRGISFSVQEPKENKKIGELMVQLSLSGLYPSLKRFLEKVEKSSRLIELENLSFSNKGREIFEFNLSFKTYFLQK